jgi:hypothetical protein
MPFEKPTVSDAVLRKQRMKEKLKKEKMSPKSVHRTASIRARAESDMLWESNTPPAFSSHSNSRTGTPSTPSIITGKRRESTIEQKREETHKHKHEHKMLNEMMMRGDTMGRNQLKWSNLDYDAPAPTNSVANNKRSTNVYTPSDGCIEPIDLTSNRFKSTVSIRPAHCKNSSAALGFSGRSPTAKKTSLLKRSAVLDDVHHKMLLDTPVTVSEGILKDSRCGAMFRTMGEFPHRDRIPLDERIRKGKELNRKPDTLHVTKAGGMSWSGINESLPWTAKETCSTDYIRGELDWLKDGAFIKPKSPDRPRTKGQISKELHEMTRCEIINFVPIHNRKEYRDNILGVRQTPKLVKAGGAGDEGGRTQTPANQGKLVFMNLREMPRGALSVIESEQRSVTGSYDVHSMEDGVALVQSSVASSEERGGGGSVVVLGEQQQPEIGKEMMKMLSSGAMLGGGSFSSSVSEVVPAGSAVGLVGRRMAPGEVKYNQAPYEKGDQPVTISEGLKASILRKKGIISF